MLRTERIIYTAIICIVLILGILIGTVLGVHIGKEKKAQRLDREYKELTMELVLERAKLQVEHSDVEYEANASLPQESAALLLFLEVDAALYDTMYAEHDIGGKRFPGVMCFSETNLPGLEGKITLEQYDTLISDRWSCALYWDGEGELSDYIDGMRESLEELDIVMPNTLVFAPRTYKLDYDELLNDNGIHYAVHYGDDGLSNIDTSVRTPVRHPGTVGWNEIQQQKIYHNTLVNIGGVGSYCFSFSNDSLSSYFDPENADLTASFLRMMNYLEQYEEDEVKIAGSFAEAWDTRMNYIVRVEDMNAYVAEKQAEIMEEINEINAELIRIYEELYGG